MSPRVLASFLAVAVAGVMIASCGDQPSPTVASPVAATPVATSASTFIDMLADPAGPLGTLADGPPVVYPPNSQWDPWPPAPPPKAQPGVPVPTDPTTSPTMHIMIESEPVFYSGVPVPLAGCDNHPHTWYYDQVLVNDSGLTLTFAKRTNFFDGRFSSTNSTAFSIRGNGTLRISTRWCSGYSKPHYAQTIFEGRNENGDPITFAGPWVRLLSR